MMQTEKPPLPAQLLAEGFATHATHWAQENQAPENLLPVVRRAAYEVSIATSEGHACTTMTDLAASSTGASEEDLRKQLLDSGIVGTPETPGVMPLILDRDGRIYLHRYFDYEQRLAKRLLACQTEAAPPSESLRKQLERLFPANSQLPDWQKLAVALALHQRLTIISGGPGTGKTTSVVNLLACLLAQNPDCRIALAAPTGKAAARMQEAIRQRASQLPAKLQELLPKESFTVHRLLGVSSRSGNYRHHKGNLLPVDVLVVDEASMLDLALATQLLEAVPQQARVILLGDKDQLSAVEAGAVFSEISADPTLSNACKNALSDLSGIPVAQITPSTPRKKLPLQDKVIWLTESYRFSTKSAIGTLASAISQGDAERTLACLQSPDDASITWFDDDSRTMPESIWQHIRGAYDKYLQLLLSDHEDKAAIFGAFDQFRVLCALREGPRGSDAINQQLNGHFRQALLRENPQSEWYPGRPVIVSKNDYLLQLFNGDIGIALRDEQNELMVYFPDSENGFRPIAPLRLPEHETAFAMTVHKSQGSEFHDVLVLLPAQQHRVTSRELLYTGITRARHRLSVAGSEGVISAAVRSPSQRHSGLVCRMEEAMKPAKTLI